MTNYTSATAKIEQNQLLNGSQENKEIAKINQIPEKARLEGKGEEVSPLTFVSPLAYKLIFHLQDKRVTQDMIMNLDPMLRVTKGFFMIKYVPKTDKRYRKGRPFQIGQDIIRMGIHVSGFRNWNYLCDRIPELDWIRRNSILNETWFDLAAMHPGMAFWFAIDWPRYYAKLKAQPGPELNGNNKPFGAYKCSAEEYRKHYKNKTATIRHLSDVLREVQEAESSSAVQEEMMEATGEATVTRQFNNQPRDPKTGVFIRKDQVQNDE